jgi:hypothetical protein
MKVALKFCGGCDPTYDRSELVRQVKEIAADSIQWLTLDDVAYEAILLVCGCDKACPASEIVHASLLIVTHHEPSPDHVVARLMEKGKNNADQD